jgi:predicted MFS family arabinose efflux permease
VGIRNNAAFAVLVLTAMNLLNYVDRWVPSAVKALFQKDLGLDDAQTSLPLSAFVVVYMISSPLFGSLAERGRRPWIIAAGVALWSLATASAALANTFTTFLIARALVGVGEAAYATIAPTLIADHYAPSARNRVLTLFYVATPVGAALGFALGGWIGAQWGWRAAFLACGLPGLLVAATALLLDDPPRGRFDDDKAAEPPPWSEALRALAKNRRYVVTVAGYIAVTFATGGLGDWFPTLLERGRHFSIEQAANITGVATVVGGLVGTILGGVIAEALVRRGIAEAYLWTSALSLVPAAILATWAMYFAEGAVAVGVGITLAQVFLWMFNGPVNTLLVNSTAPTMRARAFALSIFSIHAFGDVVSPPLVGAVSDATGNLPGAMGLVLAALVVGAVVWGGGALLLRDEKTSPPATPSAA